MDEYEHCQVLGPFNSGTALMHSYVHQLFRNFNPDRFAYWKHSIPPRFQHGKSGQIVSDVPGDELAGVLFVCMVRSPYFWLPATCRRSYNFRFHVRSFDIGHRLRSPVYLNDRLFTNLVEAWSCYYRSYAQHLESLGSVIYVRLEDLVRNPHGAVRLLETKLKRAPGSDTDSFIDSVSTRPRKADNSYGETWEEKNRLDFATRTLRREDLSFINQQLDPLLMKRFAYHYAWTVPQTS